MSCFTILIISMSFLQPDNITHIDHNTNYTYNTHQRHKRSPAVGDPVEIGNRVEAVGAHNLVAVDTDYHGLFSRNQCS